MPRVVIATPIEPELVDRIRAVDDRLDVVYESELLPTPRWASDHIGDSAFVRTPEQEARFTELVASAEIVLGYPREDPAQIAWLVRGARNDGPGRGPRRDRPRGGQAGDRVRHGRSRDPPRRGRPRRVAAARGLGRDHAPADRRDTRHVRPPQDRPHEAGRNSGQHRP